MFLFLSLQTINKNGNNYTSLKLKRTFEISHSNFLYFRDTRYEKLVRKKERRSNLNTGKQEETLADFN